LRGGGRYVDDMVVPRMVYGHVLRSPYAHARIRSIDTRAAKQMPGVLLVLAGAVIPGRLAPVYRAWMRLALLLSKVTTPIFMGLIYFVVLTPTGLLIRLVGRDPLQPPKVNGTYWVTRPLSKPADDSLTRQF
jgi:xanthine dehydrogenase molybdopterin-binding subunit B